MGEDYKEREAKLYADQAADVDIVITTALIPGRPAPRLITADMVAAMKPGSVIVDMAASNGGNVEGAVADEKTVTANGVTIIGYTDLAGRLPAQASQLYGTNLVNLMKLLTPEKDGRLVLDFDDVVQRGDDRGARRRVDLATARGVGLGRPGGAARGAARGQNRRSRPPPRPVGSASSGWPRWRYSSSPRCLPPALIGHLVCSRWPS